MELQLTNIFRGVETCWNHQPDDMEPQDIGLEDEFTEDLFDPHDSPWFPGSFHKVTQHTRQEYFFWTNNQLN